MEGANLLLIEEIVIALFLVATLVGIVARKWRVPYTLGLVLVGLVLALLVDVEVRVTEELVLALLVPPLVFEAAFHLPARELMRNALPVLLLAIPGVVLTMVVVGVLVHYGAGLDLGPAMLFGAIVAATDPVAVVALFRELGVPKRLQVLLEGESLLNDGTAIVIFHLILGILLTGTFNFAESLTDFLWVAGGGFFVGLALGGIVSAIIAQVDDHLQETALTVVLAYGAYLVAEQMHVSGVLAVVAAGLINGNIGPRGMRPTTRIVVANFWEFAAFVANSFVFLLIGLQVDLPAIIRYAPQIGWGILAVLVARAADVYLLTWSDDPIPWRWRHVLFWGGLRGAISLALALGLPEALGAQRQALQIMAFGVVLFTLLAQGSTIGLLLRRLGLVVRSKLREEYEYNHARLVAIRRALEHLRDLDRRGMISPQTRKALESLLQARMSNLEEALHNLLQTHPELQAGELARLRRELLQVQRATLLDMLQAGLIREETFAELAGEIDAALEEAVPIWPGLMLRRSPKAPPITYLTIAIIHPRDREAAFTALGELEVPFTAFYSTGGYLGKRNVTLLIGLPEDQVETVIKSLQRHCRRRVEFVAKPLRLRGTPLVLPFTLSRPKPVTVGGATVFLLPVERYEEV